MSPRPTPGAELRTNPRNPAAKWTLQLARRMARDLAARGCLPLA